MFGVPHIGFCKLLHEPSNERYFVFGHELGAKPQVLADGSWVVGGAGGCCWGGCVNCGVIVCSSNDDCPEL